MTEPTFPVYEADPEAVEEAAKRRVAAVKAELAKDYNGRLAVQREEIRKAEREDARRDYNLSEARWRWARYILLGALSILAAAALAWWLIGLGIQNDANEKRDRAAAVAAAEADAQWRTDCLIAGNRVYREPEVPTLLCVADGKVVGTR